MSELNKSASTNEANGSAQDKISRRTFTRRSAMAIAAAAGVSLRRLPGESQPFYETMQYDLTEMPPDEVFERVDRICSDSQSIDSVIEGADSEYYAEKAGLTLLETEEALHALEYAQSVEDVREAFDIFTRQFGVETTLADGWEFPKRNGQSESEAYYQDIRDIDNLRWRFRGMIHRMKHIPKELFELSGVSNIHLTEYTNPSHVRGENGSYLETHAQAEWNNDRITISLDKIFTGEVNEFTLYHEFGHFTDRKISQDLTSASLDRWFRELNEDDFEYYGVVPSELDVDGFIRLYSTYNVLEDKAIIFENMLSGIDLSLLWSDDPVVAAKYRLQLARLEWHLPGITEYLMRHSYYGDRDSLNPYNPNYGVAGAPVVAAM